MQLRLDEHVNLLGVDSQLLQQEVHDILRLIHHTCQQVYWLDGLLAIALCSVDSLLDCLLRLNGKLV